MHELTIRVHVDDAERVSALLFEAGAGGLEERNEAEATVLVTYAETRTELLEIEAALVEALASLPPLVAAPSFAIAPLAVDYERAWLEHLGPEWLTDRLVIQPRGCPEPEPPARALYYEPEMAFGTGSHPTTRLAARAVARVCNERPHLNVLDVGCGNGVLAFVALVCGASHASGIDVDPRAVRAATVNARLNGLEAQSRFEDTTLERVERVFDLVVANIDAVTLAALAPALSARTSASLLVTGVLEEQRDELHPHFERAGLRLTDCQVLDDWCLLGYERDP